ncbi:hypothetical protein D3C71_2135340 [compost metagenome]
MGNTFFSLLKNTEITTPRAKKISWMKNSDRLIIKNSLLLKPVVSIRLASRADSA